MKARRPISAKALIILSLAAAGIALAAEEETRLPVVESGIGQLELDSRSVPLEYSTTVAGPLVALNPLLARLGGILEIGPFGQRHDLELEGVQFVFGPDSPALTADDEIIRLSQKPMPGGVGLLVPLDLLRQTHGNVLGYSFEWRDDTKQLVVERRQAQDIRLDFDAVHLQGVTTLVLQLPTQPRYRIKKLRQAIDIELTGGRVQPGSSGRLPAEGWVREVRIAGGGIRIELAPGAVARDYTLDNPFRLVFDVFKGSAETPAPTPAPTPPIGRRSTGIDTIVIDPGHGGSDTGAKGPSGSLEKNLTLILARTLRQRLQSRMPVRVVLTRETDVEMPLETRSAIANQRKADLFISLHLNSFVEAGARGAETFFLSLEATDERAALSAELENQVAVANPADVDPLVDLQLILWDLAQTHHLAESQRLARLIQEELNLTLDLRNRGVKQAPFKVLMGAAMPAVLVELGFLTNPAEEEKLNDPAYRAQLVDTLVRAILRYRQTRSPRGEVAEESQ